MPGRRGDGVFVFQIIYWGPFQAGKGTALNWLYKKGNLCTGALGIAHDKDPYADIFFFDKVVSRLDIVLMCYALPSPKRHFFLRKRRLNRADGIIFMWDSLVDKSPENITSLNELLQFAPNNLPIITCANKRDLTKIISIEELRKILNNMGLSRSQIYESIATDGVGLKESLFCVAEESISIFDQKKS
ncbi:MAG: ADP-ribosylation factor-like protein [Promethearchaeota archaeon]